MGKVVLSFNVFFFFFLSENVCWNLKESIHFGVMKNYKKKISSLRFFTSPLLGEKKKKEGKRRSEESWQRGAGRGAFSGQFSAAAEHTFFFVSSCIAPLPAFPSLHFLDRAQGTEHGESAKVAAWGGNGQGGTSLSYSSFSLSKTRGDRNMGETGKTPGFLPSNTDTRLAAFLSRQSPAFSPLKNQTARISSDGNQRRATHFQADTDQGIINYNAACSRDSHQAAMCRGGRESFKSYIREKACVWGRFPYQNWREYAI